jgi:hypothetical protein
MKDNKIIVDIECEPRGITGEIHFDRDRFDTIEMMEISEMLVRVIEAYCEKRDFIHDNINDYEITFN